MILWALEQHVLEDVVERLTARREALEALLARGVTLQAAEPMPVEAPPPAEPLEPQTDEAVLKLSGILARGAVAAELALAGFAVVDADDFAARLGSITSPRILIEADSPGGDVDAVAPIRTAILAAKAKGQQVRVAVRSGGMLASAAYWATVEADEILAVQRPGDAPALFGSVGVYAVLTDISVALRDRGVRRVLISSGGVKGAGADGAVTPELVKEEQRIIDETASAFVYAIREARGVDVAPNGVLFLASEALDKELIDRIIPPEELYQRMAPPTEDLAAYRALAAEFPEHAQEVLAAIGSVSAAELRERLRSAKAEQAMQALKAECEQLRAECANLKGALQAAEKARDELKAELERMRSFRAAAPQDPGASDAGGLLTADEYFALPTAAAKAAYVRRYGVRFR